MTDNFYIGKCPAIMNNGFRGLTDFSMPMRRNQYIGYVNDLHRDDQYRIFLQKNGKEFLEREWNYHKKRNHCWVNDCVHIYPTRSNPRHFWQEMQVYNSIYDKRTNKKLAPMRRCNKYKDYRLNPISDKTYC